MKSICRCSETASTSGRGVAPVVRTAAPHTSSPRARGRRQQLRCIHPRINSVNAAAAVPIQHPGTQTSIGHSRPESALVFQSDILGLGQAIVDWSSSVTEDVLEQFDVPKGGRRVITVDERASVMETLDDIGAPSQVSAGGSLANTLVGVAKLARAAGKDMRVLLGGSLGTDTLGQFFNSQMKKAGVRCVLDAHIHTHAHTQGHQQQQHQLHQHSDPHQQQPQQQPQQQQAEAASTASGEAAVAGHTGTVMVLTTPDAQRSFLSFFTSESLTLSERLRTAVRAARLVVLEGYLWEMPGAEAYMAEVLDLAHAVGAQVAMTAGDPGVVSRHRDAMLRIIARGVDLLFTNEDEAAALAGAAAAAAAERKEDGQEEEKEGRRAEAGAEAGAGVAAALAGLCPVVVVTAGSKGSFIGAMGELHAVPPYWLPQGPVDTCGAGDAYAAGWLYAMLAGYDIRTAGEFASRVASAVIGRYGPHLSDEDAEGLVRELPEHVGPVRVRMQRGGDMELGAGGFADF
ncbi:hypothetical protein PLESTB_000462900 [Pleodorina starrii]|uniref:Carbohydrate kinase PfkB domain-containing protein n=1 Tax=Pleodorina starrii TaxID=330485 RepID=A0A9W6EZH5_9CHLO|nr:hypothetical protein PLESTM_000797400 [Pleodorina starrii]GLC51073.1 hypothetical protein PLESTB_000462900 [Pleodorina starrii]GLC63431.1 hypothetical protein PLESTF_000035400 [Pleodorina starrii]